MRNRLNAGQPAPNYVPQFLGYDYNVQTVSFAEDAEWHNFLYSYFSVVGEAPASNGLVSTYPPIDSRIYHARMNALDFDTDNSKADIYDLCRLIVEGE